MKRILVLLLCAAVALGVPMSAGAAMNKLVVATGPVNLRRGPGLNYDIIGAGQTDEALGEVHYDSDIVTDERGVDWYRVDFDRWVSSKYTVLLDMVLLPDLMAQNADLNYDPAKARDYMEMAPWYGEPLSEAAAALGLTERAYINGELPLACYRGGACVIGRSVVAGFELTGQGYTLYGVCPGMTGSQAAKRLSGERTLASMGSSESSLSYEHMTTLPSGYVEADFVMYLDLNEDGVVTAISAYTCTG